MNKTTKNTRQSKTTLQNKLGDNNNNKDTLRLWLRLLTCSSLIGAEIRRRLHKEWNTTLPRFDFTAALYNDKDGLTMSDVANRLMVTKGNITSIADFLEEDNIIERVRSPSDRRTQIVKLTDAGRKQFAERAKKHESWIDDMFQGFSEKEINVLLKALSKLQTSVENNLAK